MYCACCAGLSRMQIGIVGWITPSTGETAKDVGGLKFTPIAPSVKACLALLQQQHPDLDYVIGLSHSGGHSDSCVADVEIQSGDSSSSI